MITSLLTSLLTPSSRVLLEKLTSSQLVKKFPCGTWSFIIAVQVPTTCPYPKPDQSSSSPTIPLPEGHFKIVLPSMSGTFKWAVSLRCSHQNPVYTSLLPHTCYMPHPSHSSHFITWIIFGEQYQSLNSSFCNYLHSPVTSSLLYPNILFSTVFSNTLSLHFSLTVSHHVSHLHSSLTVSHHVSHLHSSLTVSHHVSHLHSSLTVSHHVSHLHKATANYTWVHLNLYIFRQQTGTQNILHWLIASIPWLQSALNFFSCILFWFTTLFPNILFLPLFHRNCYQSSYCDFILHSSSDMTMYLVLSPFSASPISLLVTNKVPVFLYSMSASTQYIHIISTNHQLMCII